MKIHIRILYLLSALYVVCPILIFAFGWMTLPLAFCIAFGFIFLLYKLVVNRDIDGTVTVSYGQAAAIIALLVIWTILSGAGHRGFNDGDGYKHNAILNDLITLNWPVAYRQFHSSGIVYLCYYFAYYLPAALVGKWLGWKAANIVLFGWTLGGVALAATWFLSFFKKENKTLSALLFVLFGGLDVIGRYVMQKKVVNGSDWEWWARNWQYSGNTTLLFYVPQHAIVGWMMVAMLAYAYIGKKKLPFFLTLFSCVLLWSPFVFLGLIPFVCIYVFQNRKKFVLSEWILSGLFALFPLVFFASNLTFFSKETGASAWLWQIEKLTHSFVLLRLFLFYLFEFGLFAFFITKLKVADKLWSNKILFYVSVAILLLLPWYKMGLLNDFVMRVSIPALWIVALFWIKVLLQPKWGRTIKGVLFVILCLGAAYPVVLITHGVQKFSWGPPKASLTTYEDPQFRRQYLGSPKSIFFSHFIRKNQRGTVGEMKYK